MPRTDDGQYAPRRVARTKNRRRHTVRNGLWVAAALVVVVLAFVAIYLGSIATAFNEKRQTVDAGISVGGRVDDGPLNILLLGSDSRGEGQDTAENKGEDGRRSDTMMLVHIPADRQDVYVMSIVRDLWVEIPGEGDRKINAALDLGGYPLVTQTVEDLVGVSIDHLAVIDFEGFNGLTSALGGVQLCNPNAFSSGQINPSFFPRGDILLEGADALRFVRERKAFLGGDFDRVENQQRFVSAVVDQVLTADTLANPQRIMDVVNSFAPFITVDEGLDAATIAGYAIGLNGVRSGDIHMFTIPHGPPAVGPGGASIVEQDPEGMAALRDALARDDLESFVSGGAGEAPEDASAAPESTPESTPGPTAEPAEEPTAGPSPDDGEATRGATGDPGPGGASAPATGTGTGAGPGEPTEAPTGSATGPAPAEAAPAAVCVGA